MKEITASAAKNSPRKARARVGAAAFALGLAVAGPQALGVASAEGSDSNSGPAATAQRSPAAAPTRSAQRTRPAGATTARPSAAVSGVSGARATIEIPVATALRAGSARASRSVAVATSIPAGTVDLAPTPVAPSAPVPLEALLGAVRRESGASVAMAPAAEVPLIVNAPVSAGPDPDATVATPYGDLGQWMLQANGEIADWVGLPYQGKTLLEGINVVFVDSTATSARLAARNLNVWMRRSAFGASPISSTGYQGIIGGTTYGQQPTGPDQAYRDAFFLLTNNHGRAFGPFPNPNGPGYVWIGAWSRENLDIANFTHGHESFNEARDAVQTAMTGKGATELGYIDMGNVYNTDTYSTGDSDGLAAVIGWDLPIGVSRAYRGAQIPGLG